MCIRDRACLGFAAISYWFSPLKRSDLRLVGTALLCGLLLDGALAATGWLRYAAPLPALPGPAWIATLSACGWVNRLTAAANSAVAARSPRQALSLIHI